MNDSLLNLGIAIIVWLQSLGTWLVQPMKALSVLGQEEFYLFVAPGLYWCVSAELGLRTGLLLMVSGSLSHILKLSFMEPRPYWVSPQVKALATESSFGHPSAHAQNSVVVWGTLAAALHQKWAWAAAAVVVFLISISRLYLGVHYLWDVAVGWLVGALILWADWKWEARLLAWLNKQSMDRRLTATLVASLAMILVGALIRLLQGDWQIPAAWVQRAALAAPGAEPIAPLELAGLISTAGTFLGLALGGFLLQNRGGFDAGGAWQQRLVRFLVGAAGVFAIWYGLGMVIPRGEYLLAYVLRYLRYILVGFWVTGGAPLVFVWLHIGQMRTRPGETAPKAA